MMTVVKSMYTFAYHMSKSTMQHQTITKKNIRRMLDRFYSNILKDELLAHYFIEKLGDEMISDEWQKHLDRLTDYWASITLGDKAYNGQPVKQHIYLENVQKETFERWLKLFSESVDKYYTKEIADIFKSRAEVIANSFMRLMHI